jgi:hypothetical protein
MSSFPGHVSYTYFDKVHHNFISANLYRVKFDSIINYQNGSYLYYLYFPFLLDKPIDLDVLENRLCYLENNFNIKALRIHEDLTFFNDFSNFADFGHYSKKGAISFSKLVEDKLY